MSNFQYLKLSIFTFFFLFFFPFSSFSSSPEISNSQSETFSTDDIVAFLFTKAFGFKSVFSGAKTTFSARQSLWRTGDEIVDTLDYMLFDRTNTRLELRLDIPIFDLSYYRDRSEDKRECRAFILKSLSKILSAQKSVNSYESRLKVLHSRLAYLKGQVKLSLANKSSLFSVEDQILSSQSQLHESQSVLEQRIIDLAIIAGKYWEDAYNMIIKWDGKLF